MIVRLGPETVRNGHVMMTHRAVTVPDPTDLLVRVKGADLGTIHLGPVVAMNGHVGKAMGGVHSGRNGPKVEKSARNGKGPRTVIDPPPSVRENGRRSSFATVEQRPDHRIPAGTTVPNGASTVDPKAPGPRAKNAATASAMPARNVMWDVDRIAPANVERGPRRGPVMAGSA